MHACTRSHTHNVPVLTARFILETFVGAEGLGKEQGRHPFRAGGRKVVKLRHIYIITAIFEYKFLVEVLLTCDSNCLVS